MPASQHLSFLQAGCPSCHPTNSVKAPKAIKNINTVTAKNSILSREQHSWHVCKTLFCSAIFCDVCFWCRQEDGFIYYCKCHTESLLIPYYFFLFIIHHGVCMCSELVICSKRSRCLLPQSTLAAIHIHIHSYIVCSNKYKLHKAIL